MKHTNQVLRLAIIVLFSLTFFSCQREDNAEPSLYQAKENFITLQKVNRIASQLTFDNKAKNTSQNSSKIISEIKSIEDEKNETAFYAINYQEGGFVLLAADVRSTPILSYSDSGYFDTNRDNQPKGLIYWQNTVTKNIQNLRENNFTQTAEVKYQWEHIDLSNVARKEPPDGGCVPELEIVAPLTSTTWHQKCGFNTNMPVLSCQSMPCGHAYAGCVPIAIAQVMKYHHYPTNYSWYNMPNTSGTATTASFIKDIHNALGNNISYYCDATGVSSNYDTSALFRNSFGYSSANQDEYNTTTIKQNLRDNKPVILSGGAHMWVTDGFKNGKICFEGGASWYLMFHMNWGWENGAYNGWYYCDNFNPNGNDFYNNVQMTYNINP